MLARAGGEQNIFSSSCWTFRDSFSTAETRGEERLSSYRRSRPATSSTVGPSSPFHSITARELAYDDGALRTNFRHMGLVHRTSSGSVEVVTIWDAVSVYILGQLKLEKGVLLPGLGTFAMVQERFQGEEEVFTARRPVFQLNMDVAFLQELTFPTAVIPEDVEIKPLNYRWLSRATSFPRHMVEDCVRDTILLYSCQLRNGQHLSFTFKDIGVLSCQDGVLCMRFYYDCVTGLESKASRMALLRTRLWVPCAAVSGGAATARGMQAAPDRTFPSFRFVVISTAAAEALANRHKKAAEEQRIRRGTAGHPEKLLQRRAKFSLPVLPSQSPGRRQQDLGEKTSASVLPPCPGSPPRTKEAIRQEPAPAARPTAAIPSSEGFRRMLQTFLTKRKALHTLPACSCPLGHHKTLDSGQRLRKMCKSFRGR
ncbi:coiled-coil domain-containing protein 81-like [Chroicocephalus ridibundus]|uniref:coiled-coil domain-containing protein 81-like n=1 Tax=Chroicocephalus ridibundus TaxID=1192867 RepID=UPI002FDE2713